MNSFIDDAGERVLGFVSAAKNLTRVGELTDKVTEIAGSNAWRRYTTAVGTDEWRECEFDFFLISCDLAWNDVSKIIAWSKSGAEIAPLMDHDAPPRKRRSLEAAAQAWHAPGTETLVERAMRLGWTRAETETLRAAPVPPRARARHTHGVTMDEHAEESRATRLPVRRRRELDTLATRLRKELDDDLELRYVIDQLRHNIRRGRRAAGSDLDRWRADAERLKWNVAGLAEFWDLSPSQVHRRFAKLRA